MVTMNWLKIFKGRMWVKEDCERGFYEENVFFISGDSTVCSFKPMEK